MRDATGRRAGKWASARSHVVCLDWSTVPLTRCRFTPALRIGRTGKCDTVVLTWTVWGPAEAVLRMYVGVGGGVEGNVTAGNNTLIISLLPGTLAPTYHEYHSVFEG